MDFHNISAFNRFSEFIRTHINDDPTALRLKYKGKISDFDSEFAILQIECRKKFRKKLRQVISSTDFIFPSILSGEQSSHEAVAAFHGSLIPEEAIVADLTSGLGIDTFYMAKKAKSLTAFEIDPVKANFLSYNSRILGKGNITVVESDSIKWIEDNPEKKFDIIFVDPARRGDGNTRLYNLHECSPDIISNQAPVLDRCSIIFIKASPMLDIVQTIRDFPSIYGVKCISVDGECKEVLLELRKEKRNISFEALNLHSDGRILSQFSYSSDESGKEIQWAEISELKENAYLYEPDASVMKFAPWKFISQKYNTIKKLGPSSHLFVSGQLFKDFPGRILQIQKQLTKKDFKQLRGEKINVVTRNYPLQADQLRKKLSLQEGKDTFIYATRLGEAPTLLLAERLHLT